MDGGWGSQTKHIQWSRRHLGRLTARNLKDFLSKIGIMGGKTKLGPHRSSSSSKKLLHAGVVKGEPTQYGLSERNDNPLHGIGPLGRWPSLGSSGCSTLKIPCSNVGIQGGPLGQCDLPRAGAGRSSRRSDYGRIQVDSEGANTKIESDRKALLLSRLNDTRRRQFGERQTSLGKTYQDTNKKGGNGKGKPKNSSWANKKKGVAMVKEELEQVNAPLVGNAMGKDQLVEVNTPRAINELLSATLDPGIGATLPSDLSFACDDERVEATVPTVKV